MMEKKVKIRSNWLAHEKNISDSQVNIVCFPFAGGSASYFASWGKCISDSVGLMPVLYPMRELRMSEPMPEYIDELADMIAGESILFEKKFIMFSHCTGSLVAYETARKLMEKYGVSPDFFVTASEPSPRKTIVNRAVFDMDDNEFANYAVSLKLLSSDMVKNADFMRYYFPAFKADFLMHQRYDAEAPAFTLECPILALRGSEDELSTREIISDWSKYTESGFEYHEFTGGHFFIDQHKNEVIALILEAYERIGG
ncbi:thioesterase domain-containing protein [Ruminococcus sp.]|uniref:thioesterase II family protein n=1 Tax=Ruminococcus sp. TaxID=41978 RepID=UPI0025EF3A1E|nr:thioesterase domain-containing protein [Ruminococcus sp.]MCR4639216.1 hypothetical protein [Ruminococcus sp.]